MGTFAGDQQSQAGIEVSTQRFDQGENRHFGQKNNHGQKKQVNENMI